MSEYRIKGETLTGIADAIRSKTGGTEPIPVPDMAVQIEGISGGGGGSSADVCYVTFMSHDGTVELGKKAVAVGDDCADPIARGVFDTPTRESDAQYNYAFAGWSKNPDNVLDDAALDAVTEDRVVYAVYAATVRYYTITYYDSDGTTVLKSESLAYGSEPSYAPTKEDYMFGGWEPEPATVTEDASYKAVWIEKITFATGSWESINAVCMNGQAAECFSAGDERTETLTYADGTTENVTFVIVDINTCEMEDGTSAGIVLGTKHALATAKMINNSMSVKYHKSEIDAALDEEIFEALPQKMRDAIKTRIIFKYADSTAPVTAKCWLFSTVELNLATAATDYEPNFDFFIDNSRRIRNLGETGTATEYWTRTAYNSGAYSYYKYVTTAGALNSSNGHLPNTTKGIVFGCCI